MGQKTYVLHGTTQIDAGIAASPLGAVTGAKPFLLKRYKAHLAKKHLRVMARLPLLSGLSPSPRSLCKTRSGHVPHIAFLFIFPYYNVRQSICKDMRFFHALLLLLNEYRRFVIITLKPLCCPEYNDRTLFHFIIPSI